MEQNNKKNDSNNDTNTSIRMDNNEMSESQQQYHQQQSQQQQRLSMEDTTTPPSSRLSSSTIELGVNEDIEEEEDNRNFVSTLDVDAIKVHYFLFKFQIAKMAKSEKLFYMKLLCLA